MRVETYDELKRAAESGSEIDLDADIVWPHDAPRQGLRIRRDCVVIRGNGHTLDMTAVGWPGVKTNGIEPIGRDAYIEDLTIRGFGGGLSALKCYIGNASDGWGGGTEGRLVCRNVHWVDVGSTPRPFAGPEPVPDSSHCWFDQPVGGQVTEAVFIGCSWKNCALTNYWAHCVYLTKNIRTTMIGCRTINSGDVLQTSGEQVIIDCDFEVAAIPWRTSEKKLPPLFSLLRPGIVWNNTFRWTGDDWHIRPVRTPDVDTAGQSALRGNTYIGPVPQRWWAPGKDKWRPRAEWPEKGSEWSSTWLS
jgi:hypothetical protein